MHDFLTTIFLKHQMHLACLIEDYCEKS